MDCPLSYIAFKLAWTLISMSNVTQAGICLLLRGVHVSMSKFLRWSKARGSRKAIQQMSLDFDLEVCRDKFRNMSPPAGWHVSWSKYGQWSMVSRGGRANLQSWCFHSPTLWFRWDIKNKFTSLAWLRLQRFHIIRVVCCNVTWATFHNVILISIRWNSRLSCAFEGPRALRRRTLSFLPTLICTSFPSPVSYSFPFVWTRISAFSWPSQQFDK